ncbi:MAG: L-rhamnose isomerase [Spirochaetales bacterium]|nr:L-rhamnose isomerase [Spirochaetales bacterium]
MNDRTLKMYNIAKEMYAELGVDTDKALEAMKAVSLSLHCWQTDDVGGFETPDAELSGGGIQVTGNYPGKSRSIPEMRDDLDKAFSLIPGTHRLNLHSIYGEFDGKKVELDEIGPEHFTGWVEWAKERKLGLDYNGSFFSHPMADTGYTLSSKDKTVRDFWIRHGQKSREVAAYFGRELGTPSIINTWIPDGSKDVPVDRMGYRSILKDSLDEVFAKDFPASEMRDAVETKLFGIGSESFVVGSHEFYMGYAMSRKKMVCLDLGHFHPTELIADKLSSVYQFFDEVLLHVSRPVRWDSDHVVILNDDIRYLTEEIVRCGNIKNTYIGLDFFDGTMNRIGAYAIGARSTLKGLLMAYLEPSAALKQFDAEGNAFGRLALLEQLKSMPSGAVWDYYCEMMGVPVEGEMIKDVLAYEKDVLAGRK